MNSSSASTGAITAASAAEETAERRPRIFVVAGEPSGDRHAALLGVELCARAPVALAGVGQRLMRAGGFDLLCDSAGWSAIGVAESLRRVPMLHRHMRTIVRHLRSSPPDLLVLVDFGAFNVRLARRLQRQGRPPVLYYFPPRSWSREADYRGLAGLVDRVATPFAWSVERLHAVGLDATWVGHPVVDHITPPSAPERAELRRALGVDTASTVVGLLPGSRPQEIGAIGPTLLGAARIIAAERPATRFVLSVAPSSDERVLYHQVERAELADRVTLRSGVTEIVRAADLVLTASGTATLEAAAALCPMVVVYRGTGLMKLEMAARRARFDYVALPNIVAAAGVVPELLAEDATPENMAAVALELLGNPAAAQAMRDRLVKVRAQLGPPGVSGRVAQMALEMIAS